MPYKDETAITATTIAQSITFWSFVFTYGPINSLSFSSRIRNTKAAGRRVTATACTKSVISTEGTFGIRTIAPASATLRK